VDTGIC